MARQIRKCPRQCVVLLNRDWIFQIGRADFHLKPRVTQDPEAFTEERLAFVRQPIPNEYVGTYDEMYTGALQQLLAADLETLRSSGYNTRMNTPFQPELGNEIRYAKLKYLGGGSQGYVYKVVDLDTGDYYACKIIQPKRIPGLEITEKDFKLKIEAQVALLKDLRHDHILPYLCSQGWSTDQEINIFQPLCEGNFSQQIADFRSQEDRWTRTMTMFREISLGLHYIHTHDPIIIRRDIKPENIMCRRGKYLLGDFGIATTVDNSHSLVGTNFYMAPELWQGGVQTTKLDIYGLGATIVEALDGFPSLAERPGTWRRWHHYLQTHANEPLIASMLADSSDERPTAHQITRTFFPDSLSLVAWTQMESTKLSPKLPRQSTQNTTLKRPTQSCIALTKLAKSTSQERGRTTARSEPVRIVTDLLQRASTTHSHIGYPRTSTP
ncbi:hypothetical protein EG329_006837 [Mollisiaceae sp. DMI_Dod_QoI]|nr:hypothetical protein EG329_006837 [Helotiales sp. DMI_Dod_QoI]